MFLIKSMNRMVIHSVIIMEEFNYGELLFPNGGKEFYGWSEFEVLS